MVYDYYYENYLMLYSLYGRGRPRVTPERYNELDTELMGILERVTGDTLSAQDASRISEIEYLLLDDIAESLLERSTSDRLRGPAATAASAALAGAGGSSRAAAAPVEADTAMVAGKTGDGESPGPAASSGSARKTESARGGIRPATPDPAAGE